MPDNAEEKLAEIAREDAAAAAELPQDEGISEEALVEAAAVEGEQVEETIETPAEDVNPWKQAGFENEKEFGDFVSEMREYKSKADKLEGEFDAYKAGASQQPAEPAAPSDGRFNKYPFVGKDKGSYQTDEVAQEEVNDYAVEFFRAPREQVIDLIADDVEAFVNARIHEVLSERDTSAHVDSRSGYLTENQSKVDALKELYPNVDKSEILKILDVFESEKPKDPDKARDEDARGINTETGTAPRTGPKSPVSTYDSDDAEESKFLNKISRMVS